jgi:hypothetical protein
MIGVPDDVESEKKLINSHPLFHSCSSQVLFSLILYRRALLTKKKIGNNLVSCGPSLLLITLMIDWSAG